MSLGSQPQTFQMASGIYFDPDAFAADFTANILPSITQVSPAAKLSSSIINAGSELTLETTDLAPPPQITHPGDLFQVLMGMVALRAATPSFEPTVTSAHDRIQKAKDWL